MFIVNEALFFVNQLVVDVIMTIIVVDSKETLQFPWLIV